MAYYPVDIYIAVRKECRRRRYSERTADVYLFWIKKFFEFSRKEPRYVSKKDVRLFLEHLSEKKCAGNTLNTCHMAIKFLFEQVLDKRIWINIKYSKVPERLPVVLTKEEVKKLFDAISNEKHKLMIKLMYSAGMRVSELVNLRPEDLKIDDSYGFVRHGKGGKDRLFIIAESLKQELKKFIGSKKLDEYNFLFTSNRKGKYSMRSLQQIIKKASKEAGLGKRVSCHTLRHSFATHLLEQGSSISEVQSLLGHKSPETTFIYLHTASPNMIKIKSPLDNLV